MVTGSLEVFFEHFDNNEKPVLRYSKMLETSQKTRPTGCRGKEFQWVNATEYREHGNFLKFAAMNGLKGLLAISNSLIVIVLIAPYTDRFFPEGKAADLVYLSGFFFPVFLLVNAIFLLFWAFFKRSFIWLPLLGFGLCWQGTTATFSVPLMKNQSGELKLMSWNVRNFDLYNWSKNLKTKQLIMEAIKTENPNILCLQEFYTENTGPFRNLEFLRDTLGYSHFHFEKTLTLRERDHWGIATFGRYPIINTEVLRFPNSVYNLAIISDLQTSNGVIRIVNIHFQSIHLGDEFHESVNQGNWERFSNPKFGIQFFMQLTEAWRKRKSQVETLSAILENSPYPVLLCGDFNDLPTSPTYRTLAKGKTDSFRWRTLGFGKTYDSPVPFLRIDYVLTDSSFKTESYQALPLKLSDHYPLVVEFSLEN